MAIKTIPGDDPSKYQGRVDSLLPPGWIWSTLAEGTETLTRCDSEKKMRLLTRLPMGRRWPTPQGIASVIAAGSSNLCYDVRSMAHPRIYIGACKETRDVERRYVVNVDDFGTPGELYDYLSDDGAFDIIVIDDRDTFQETAEVIWSLMNHEDSIGLVIRDSAATQEKLRWLRSHPKIVTTAATLFPMCGDERPTVSVIPHQYRDMAHVSGRKDRWSIRWMGAALQHERVHGLTFHHSDAVIINARFFEAFLGHKLSVHQKLDFQIGELIKGGLFDRNKMPILLFSEVAEDSPLRQVADDVHGVWLQFAPDIIDRAAAYSDMGMGYLPRNVDLRAAVEGFEKYKLFPVIVPVPADSLRAKKMEKYVRENGVVLEGLIDHAANTERS